MESFDLNSIKIFRQSTLSYWEGVLASTPYANNKKVTHFVSCSSAILPQIADFYEDSFYGLPVRFAIRGTSSHKIPLAKHK